MMGISSVKSDAKQRRRESVQEEKEAESSDEEMKKRESDSEDEADRSADSIELDLTQKPTPPSKKYQPALAPQRLVRTDHRSNTIDRYFFLESQRTQLSQLSQSSSQGTAEELNASPHRASKRGDLSRDPGNESCLRLNPVKNPNQRAKTIVGIV
ncbi:hypothetical protein DVH05_006216 [Phytophthora capsici]|nr:hypothetical protein DVH05_006216 [Phytophthora capsici]